MSDDKLRTNRGFRVFLAGIEQVGGMVSVVESSADGFAHCILYEENESRALKFVLLNVTGAKAVRDALDVFIQEAEAGELTSPATREGEE